MSVDYILWATDASSVISSIILLAGTVRALQLARGFAAHAFRNRAYWLAGLMIALIAGNVASQIPTPATVVTLQDFIISSIGGDTFVAALLIALVFVDRNLIVLKELDFFHRDSIRWSRVRVPGLIAMILVSAELVVSFFFVNTNSNLNSITLLVILTFFPVVAIVLGYAATALVLAARRTPDRTMRRFAMLLGIALALGVISFTIWIPLSFVTTTEVENFIASLPAVGSAYFLYRAAMSLSPLGRVEKGTE
ncbi:MAG TPA: hypothetical protein VKF39_05130 [Nitrososphaerales archaeon]|nr:hypothetical protein [Nitrososphaerales archaeon]